MVNTDELRTSQTNLAFKQTDSRSVAVWQSYNTKKEVEGVCLQKRHVNFEFWLEDVYTKCQYLSVTKVIFKREDLATL